MGRGPFVAGVAGRRQRAKLRQNICLREVGVSSNTRARYHHSVNLLLKGLHEPQSTDELDEQVAEWVENEFKSGTPLTTVADALSGLHFFIPSTRKKLPISWKLFGTWRKVEIPSRAAPLPEDVAWAFMARALELKNFAMASLIGLGFDCFLRTGELLAIRPCDILLQPDAGIVTLPCSKGGTRHNVSESVTIENPEVRILLAEFLELRRANHSLRSPIWEGSGTSFRAEFQALVSFFHLTHLNFRGYSLRRGGATAYFRRCGLMEKTLLRGRWASVAVARLYLCDALSQLPHLTASRETQRLVNAYRAFWSTS